MWFPVNSEPSGEEEEEDLQAEAGSLNIEPGTELDYGKVFTVCVCVHFWICPSLCDGYLLCTAC